MASEPLSANVEEYLEAIHRLGLEPEGVSTGRLARHLSVTPASVTGMLRRLAKRGLIAYHRYQDIILTPTGQRQAQALIRRHRLAERLLTDFLKVPLDRAHDEACRLEHVLSPDLASRVSGALGGPETCPHGHPINLATRDQTHSLLDAPLRRRLVISRLEDESPEIVRYLSARGLLPGARLLIKSRQPASGTVEVEAKGETHALGRDLAAGIRVVQTKEAKNL